MIQCTRMFWSSGNHSESRRRTSRYRRRRVSCEDFYQPKWKPRFWQNSYWSPFLRSAEQCAAPPDDRDGWCEGVVMECDANGIRIAWDRKRYVIGAGSGAQRMHHNHECQPPHVMEARRDVEREDDEVSRNKEKSRQHGEGRNVVWWRLLQLPTIRITIFNSRYEFSTVLRSQHFFKQRLADTYCKTGRESLS